MRGWGKGMHMGDSIRRPASGIGVQVSRCPLPHSDHLQLEHGVLVGDVNERVIAVAPLVGHAGEVGVTLLRVLADSQRVVERVGGEEVLRVVVGVNDDLA